MKSSVPAMWEAYLRLREEDAPPPTLSSWHFCDNEVDADTCADLVLRGIKSATAPSLWGLEARGEPLPRPGELHVVTTWAGEAVCVIRTTRVEIVPFDQVTAEHAAAEGEGDRSLDYWRRVHWPYYHRELDGTRYSPAEDMPIVCEYFEVVYPPRPEPGTDE